MNGAAGETDIMPETMLVNKYIMGFPHRKNVEFCYLSKVCTFTERLLVYGIKKGYVDVVREPVKEMMREIGVPYANSFLEHTVQTYQLSKEDIMQMYSAIYAISGNAKAEKEFYQNFICAWLEPDQTAESSCYLQWEKADDYEKTHDYDIHILDENGSVLYRYPDVGNKAMCGNV